MVGFLADCRHAARLYARTPGASALAVLVLAVALAVAVAFLSLYVDLILRPHPGFARAGRMATLERSNGTVLFLGIPYGIVERMTEEMSSIEAAVMSRAASAFIGPEHASAVVETVSADFFDALGPRLALGSGFRPEHHTPDAEPVAVISHRLWRERFDADPDVLGTTLEVARNPSVTGQPFAEINAPVETVAFRIVGVMARELPGLVYADTSVWLPLERAHELFVGERTPLPATTGRTYVRRRAGASVAAVESEFEARYGAELPPTPLAGVNVEVVDGLVSNVVVQRAAKRQLEMFLAGSVLLALVAAANVSLFLLARAPGRRRELGIRAAIGAPLKRLARQLATEAGLLVAAAAAIALPVSIWLGLYLKNLTFIRQAEWRHVTLFDWRVLTLAAAFLAVLTVLVSLAPVLGLGRHGIAASSRHATARASLAQRIAGTVQIALAGLLGGAAIAFGWHLGALVLGGSGFETADRYWVRFSSDSAGSFVERSRRREAIESLPGVTTVAFGNPVPGADLLNYYSPLQIASASGGTIEGYLGNLEAQYAELLGFTLLHGRLPDDGEDGSVVVVNQALARALFGRDDVVGEQLPASTSFAVRFDDREIIGVLADVPFQHPLAPVPPFVFAPLARAPTIATVVEAELTAAELRQALDGLRDAGRLDVDVTSVEPLAARRNALLAPDRARGFLTIAAALLVVVLAALGYYGTQRYLVAAGRREYAIRASLGAGPRAVRHLVLRRGLATGAVGVGGGAMLAFIAAAWLRGDYVLREISPAVVAAGMLAGLLAVLLAASAGPARRAGSIQPAAVLREE